MSFRVCFGLEVRHLLKAIFFSAGSDVSRCLKIRKEPWPKSDERKQSPTNNFKHRTNGITTFFNIKFCKMKHVALNHPLLINYLSSSPWHKIICIFLRFALTTRVYSSNCRGFSNHLRLLTAFITHPALYLLI